MKIGHHIVFAIVLLSNMAPPITDVGASEKARQKAVLVTGASTGIGRLATERLAAAGHFVYAGARKQSDLDQLGAIENVQPIRLDVTRADEIASAFQAISSAGRGLYAIVNNAGITSSGSILDFEQDEFDLVMGVNAAGPIRVTRAFAPLVIAEKGRIVNIGSILGVLSPEGVNTYCMSKHALESFTDTLAAEMFPLGVQVSLVEPGTYKTEISRNAFARGAHPMPDDLKAAISKLKEPAEVAIAIELALFESIPKRRYLVVPNLEQHEAVIGKMMEELVQLNEGQPYTFDRDALVKLLDSHLANSRPRKDTTATTP